MVRLFEQDIKTNERKSSKGNQLKWNKEDMWYKADYTGYEGLAEYMSSHLLTFSNLATDNYVLYDTEDIVYGDKVYHGCRSKSFLHEGEQLVTLERLFAERYGESLYRSIYAIEGVEDRLKFIAEQVERMTGIEDFGASLCDLLTIDALFLNEDRHTHNIAVIRKPDGGYRTSPIFDNGAGLLSDTTMDYPIGQDVYTLIDKVQAKTVCSDFTEQLEAAEDLFGQRLHFGYGHREIDALLEADSCYGSTEKDRVRTILNEQRRKLIYLFDYKVDNVNNLFGCIPGDMTVEEVKEERLDNYKC